MHMNKQTNKHAQTNTHIHRQTDKHTHKQCACLQVSTLADDTYTHVCVHASVQISTLAGDTLPCVLVAAKEDLAMGEELEKELAMVMDELQVCTVCVCALCGF